MLLLRKIRLGLMVMLREIFDENAYQRHLAAHGAVHSAQEWRKFTDERFAGKYKRPKCC